MALYKEVDYCTEEVRSVASPVGFGRNVGGVQQYVVKKKTFEEVDQVPRVGHGHRYGNHGHGHGGAVQQYVVEERFEEVDQVPHVGGGNHGNRGHHGHGGFGNHFAARETKFEENINTGTGEFHERKENFLVRN